MQSINSNLPYSELQLFSKSWRDKCSREYRLQSRIEKLRPSQKQWLFWSASVSGILGLIAIHVAQLVG